MKTQLSLVPKLHSEMGNISQLFTYRRRTIGDRLNTEKLSPMRVAIFFIFLSIGIGQYVQANPLGPNVANGIVEFANPNANTLQITNSPGAIVNWQSFGISPGEVTQFIQQSADSAILNRVTGQDPSQISGQLNSNGQVYLINPNGIVIGSGAMIDTAGFVASTLNMTDEEFKRGELNFSGDEAAGQLVNRGFIRVGEGGNVLLVAPSIRNEGTIETQNGNLVLAAGHRVTITSMDEPGLQFDVLAPEGSVVNLGELIVGHGALEIFAGTIRHEGAIDANSLQVDAQGRIRLFASDEIQVTDNALVQANGRSGGDVHIESQHGDTIVRGTIEALGSQGAGGEIAVLGNRVGVFGNSKVNASGKTGGGNILLGGDFQGSNADVQNARQTIVGDNAIIAADADAAGDGGKVIVWADDHTGFSGKVSASAGTEQGNGGFIEISGKESLAFSGDVRATAANGNAGTVLFDPKNIDINSAGSAAVASNDEFTEAPTASVQIDPADILGILDAGTDVHLRANNDILVSSALSATTAFTDLTLEAGRTVDVNADLRNDFGQLTLIANSAAPLLQAVERDAGAGDILIRANRTVSTGPGFGPIALEVQDGGTVGGITLESNAAVNVFETSMSMTTASGGFITLNTGAGISTVGGNLTLVADTIDLPAGVPIQAASGLGFVANISIAPASLGRGIDIVTTAGAPGPTLELEALDLQNINVNGLGDGILILGNATTGDINIDGAFTPAGGGNEKDRVEFINGSGDLNFNATLDGTGLTGANSGHSIEASIAQDINFNATFNSGAANALLNFSQAAGPGVVSLNNATITSPLLTLNGNAPNDQIVGSSLADTVTITGSDLGTIDNANTSVISFTNIPEINTAAGDDTIIFSTGGSLSGLIVAGLGSDTVDLSALGATQNLIVTGPGTTEGYDVSLPLVSGGDISGLNTIIGGTSATDSITGPNSATTWNYTGTDAANITNGVRIMNFSSFESIFGGSANDAFIVGAGAISNSLNGGAGTDTISYSSRSTALTFDLSTLTFPSVTTIFGIESVVGGTGLDQLQGDNTSNTWNITFDNTGDVNGFAFTGVEILTGGSVDDTFIFADGTTVTQVQGNSTPAINKVDLSAYTSGVTVNQQATNFFDIGGGMSASNVGNIDTGSGNDTFVMANNALALYSGAIDGGGGSNTLDYGTNLRNEAGGITIDLQASTATDISGGFTSIQNFVGSTATATNTFIGDNSGGTWNPIDATSGTFSGISYSAFNNVIAGSGNDIVNIPSGFNGVFTASGGTNSFNILGGIGASANISGSGGDDIFNFSGPGGTISGSINAGTGNDILRFSSGAFVHAGTFVAAEDIEVNGGDFSMNVATSVNNFTVLSGIARLNNTSLTVLNPLQITGGSFHGAGSILADVNNTGGIFSAGASPGGVFISGNLTLGSASTLLVELQAPGTTQGVDYDHITVSGVATLDGTLQIMSLGGFEPSSGQLFDIINYSSVLGDFASVPDVVVPSGTLTFSGSDQGMFYRISNGPVSITPPIIPDEPVVVLPEDNEEPDLSEVIALESNSDLLESELVEETGSSTEADEDEEKKEYKVCTG